MNYKQEETVSNETPEGVQFLYGQFSSHGGWYNCEYIPDIPYVTYDDITLTLQVIKPNFETNEKLPLIIFIQGSAWRKQNIYSQIPNLSVIAAKGYVIASVQYRDTDKAQWPAQIEDVKCAIRFMRKNAEKYNVDPTKVGVWGDSSGGHLSLMTGLTIGKYDNGKIDGFGDEVLAVVDFYGISDILTLGDFNELVDHSSAQCPEGLLLGGKVADKEKEAKEASPVYQDLNQKLPPILIVHGDSDRVVHVSQSIEMYKVLKQHGKKALFYKVIGADHGLGIWNPDVLQLTEKFFAANLKRAEIHFPPQAD